MAARSWFPIREETTVAEGAYLESLVPSSSDSGLKCGAGDDLQHQRRNAVAVLVSKNGTFLLSVPQLPDGTIDSREESTLDEIAKWVAVNGEGIFSTRPWKQFGEGPASVPGGSTSERGRKPMTPDDFRFTTRNGKLYAFCMGWPEKDVEVRALGSAAGLWNTRIEHIRLLGSEEKLKWTVSPEHLRISRPLSRPSNYAITFEIS